MSGGLEAGLSVVGLEAAYLTIFVLPLVAIGLVGAAVADMAGWDQPLRPVAAAIQVVVIIFAWVLVAIPVGYGILHTVSARYAHLTRCAHGVRAGETKWRCARCREDFTAKLAEAERNLVTAIEAEETEFHRQQQALEQRFQEEKKALQTLAGLRRLSPAAFEQLVAKLYAARGWNVEVTPASGDQGVDVIGRKGSEVVAIQCKLYAANTKVGAPEVQNLYGAAAQLGAERKVIVTTGDLTEPALRAAKSLGVEVVNGGELLGLMSKLRWREKR